MACSVMQTTCACLAVCSGFRQSWDQNLALPFTGTRDFSKPWLPHRDTGRVIKPCFQTCDGSTSSLPRSETWLGAPSTLFPRVPSWAESWGVLLCTQPGLLEFPSLGLSPSTSLLELHEVPSQIHACT